MRYWWVNQNQTFSHEFHGGYLWSPKRKSNQAINPFYEFIREVSPGDIILCFQGAPIRAIGVAQSSREIGVHLKSLVEHGWLGRSGQARGTRYRLPGRAETGQLFPAAEPAPRSSEQKTPGSEQYKVDSEQYVELIATAAPVREKGRASKALVRDTIVQLCTGRFLTLRTLADLLDREPDSVRNHYITPMLREGLIRARFPDHPNHPQQAYSAIDKPRSP